MNPTWSVIEGDARVITASLPAASVHCCVTSPPYWGLRDYGVAGQIGRESSPEEYVANVLAVCAEVHRVLRSDGSFYLNLGDSFADDRKWGGSSGGRHRKDLHGGASGIGRGKRTTGLAPKNLVGIPWMVAFALRAQQGWVLRSDVVWSKPNPTPESVKDRPTRSHEYVFLLTKSPRYFYDVDATREPHVDRRPAKVGKTARRAQVAQKPTGPDFSGRWFHPSGRNAKSVWTIATRALKEEHYASFPPELARRCIVAGTSLAGACARCGKQAERVVERLRVVDGEKAPLRAAQTTSQSAPSRAQGVGHNRIQTLQRELGWKLPCACGVETVPSVVFDPFAGSGTTGSVALANGRSFIGIELHPGSAALARRSIEADAPLFNRPRTA